MAKLLTYLLLLFSVTTPVLGKNSPNLYLVTTGNKVEVFLHPTQPISTFAFKLLATNVDVVDSADKPLTELVVNPAFTSDGTWLLPFKKVVRQDGQIWIEFAGANISQTGWLPTKPTLLSTFYVTGTGSSPSLVFDPTVTALMAKSDATNIIALSSSPLSLDIPKTNFFMTFFRQILRWFGR